MLRSWQYLILIFFNIFVRLEADQCIVSPVTQTHFQHSCQSSLVATYDDVGKYNAIEYQLEVLYRKNADDFYISCDGLTIQGYLKAEKHTVYRREVWVQLGSPSTGRNTYQLPFEWSVTRWFRADNRESGFVPAIRCSSSELAVVKFSAVLKT